MRWKRVCVERTRESWRADSKRCMEGDGRRKKTDSQLGRGSVWRSFFGHHYKTESQKPTNPTPFVSSHLRVGRQTPVFSARQFPTFSSPHTHIFYLFRHKDQASTIRNGSNGLIVPLVFKCSIQWTHPYTPNSHTFLYLFAMH